MKILLVCLNSKYIHTSLAIWYIKEYCKNLNAEIYCLDSNVNKTNADIISEILNYNADVIGFSTYIFNVEKVKEILPAVKASGAKIVLGGPEAEFNREIWHFADTVMTGEGETAWESYIKGNRDKFIASDEVENIVYPYTEEYFKNAEGKMAYFEASRGCPFSCTYCMSGEKPLRYFDIAEVKRALLKFKGKNIRVLKFCDRTFNANKKYACEIFKFVIDNFINDGIIFHFEVAPELFDENIFEILKTAPIGLIQLEAGIQTFNERSLKAVKRGNAVKAEENLKRLVALKNCHIHTDLIAGLPYEDLASFKESFNRLFAVRANQLQLGFLKILKGSALEKELPEGYIISPSAPYEVLETPDLSKDDFCILKGVNEALERIYNSGKFNSIINLAIKDNTPFDFFYEVGKYFEPHCSLFKVVEAVKKYLVLEKGYCEETISELLRFDYLSTDNSKILPPVLDKRFSKDFKKQEAILKTDYPNYEFFRFVINPIDLSCGNYAVGFDYGNKNKVTGEYGYIIIKQ